jgi:hypothetical protein
MKSHSGGGHVAHSSRHGEIGRRDRRTTPDHGASSKQGYDVEPSPSPSTSQRGNVSVNICNTRIPLLKRRAARTQDPLSLFFFLFFLFLSLSCTPGLPLVYKREDLAPRQGRFFLFPASKALRLRGLGDLLSTNRRHFNSTSLSPETWELFPLSTVCNPYYRPKCK